MNAQNPIWYKTKNYAHFDLPLSAKKAQALVTDPKRVSRHSFWPFLHFQLKTRRFKSSPKTRDIRYAAHKDRYIYAYYAKNLSEKYESRLFLDDLENCVLAYRSGIGSNVTFARTAFKEIRSRNACVAIGFDIESFFDNLDHAILKSLWLDFLDISPQSKLPDDNFAVFKAITQFADVNVKDCYKRLKYNQNLRKTKRPICSPQDFRTKIAASNSPQKSLIRVNKTKKGIPQGSPISAILANLYLINFDRNINNFVRLIDGAYFRYSDDILVIASNEYEAAIKEFVGNELKRVKLTFNSAKTTIAHFQQCPHKMSARENVILTHGSKPLQYLGFLYDGQRILLRSQTLSSYWRKTKRYIARAKRNAARSGRVGRSTVVFRRKAKRLYTQLGAHNGSGRNFIGYVIRSAREMGGVAWKQTSIWKQVRSHRSKIDRLF